MRYLHTSALSELQLYLIYYQLCLRIVSLVYVITPIYPYKLSPGFLVLSVSVFVSLYMYIFPSLTLSKSLDPQNRILNCILKLYVCVWLTV